MHAILGQGVMAQQPGPDRPLMIAAIAFPNPAEVVGAVIGMIGREGTKTVGGQQLPPADAHHGLLDFGFQWTMGQADGEV